MPDRGRRFSQKFETKPVVKESLKRRAINKQARAGTPNYNSSSGKSGHSSSGLQPRDRSSFTRSRSPAVPPPIDVYNGHVSYPLASPSFLTRYRLAAAGRGTLPAVLQVKALVPMFNSELSFHIDTRKAGESLLLLMSLIYASSQLSGNAEDPTDADGWISWGNRISSQLLPSITHSFTLELKTLAIVSFIYTLWTHSSLYRRRPASQSSRESSSRSSDERSAKRYSGISGFSSSSGNKSHFSFVWMTVPKNYR